MESGFKTFDLAPAFESFDRVSMSNVVRFEEAPAIKGSKYASWSVVSLKCAIDISL